VLDLGTPYAAARRLVVAVIGATLIAVGVALLVLPGPGLLVLWAGLGVLALEFAWARRWLRRLRNAATEAGRRAGASVSRREEQ
jgi:tellurite resistance protein TerC